MPFACSPTSHPPRHRQMHQQRFLARATPARGMSRWAAFCGMPPTAAGPSSDVGAVMPYFLSSIARVSTSCSEFSGTASPVVGEARSGASATLCVRLPGGAVDAGSTRGGRGPAVHLRGSPQSQSSRRGPRWC
eukprot:scaffold12977_cov119-Isochrysis_galbana.AAC.3